SANPTARDWARSACRRRRPAGWPRRPVSRGSASSTSSTASTRSTKSALDRIRALVSAALDHFESALGEQPRARSADVTVVVGDRRRGRLGALALLGPLLQG